jgi:hypothetical protein
MMTVKLTSEVKEVCLYGAGTKVTKGEKQGEYICINNKQKIKMPEELKSFLLENIYTSKPNQVNKTVLQQERW